MPNYKTKMHPHTKRHIDKLYTNITYNTPCVVSLTRLNTEDIPNFKRSLIKNKDYAPTEIVDEPKKDSSTSQKDKKSKEDDKTSNDDKKSITDTTTIGLESPKKKQKFCTEIDVLKLGLSKTTENHTFKSDVKSSIETNKEIASTSTEVPMVIDCKESTESVNSSALNVTPMIAVIDPKKMMSENNYLNWMEMLAVTDDPSTSRPESFNDTKVKVVTRHLNSQNPVRKDLIEIEKLYIKYFSKSAQETVVVIANILNIISMSNKYHEARINESSKNKSEAEKLKENCDADKLHIRHKIILDTKLKINFMNVVSSFAESEFDSVFRMFFLSILTVLRVLDQPKFRKGGIFKNLVLLLWNSLKNREYIHPKIFSMFRSKTFRPDCIDLISRIEDSRDIDPGVTNRMTLFFISTVYGREYFQAVIDAVTSDSNEDLELLIDNAIFQCRINSKFKDPVNASTVQHSNDKISVPQTTQRPTNSNGTIQNWFIANNQDATYRQLPQLNLVQTIGNAAVKASIVTSQPLNNFYEPSSSQQKKTSESSASNKVIPIKKCIFVTPTISNSSLVQVIPPIQNKTFVANGHPHTAVGATIGIGNRQYHLIKRTFSQIREVVNSTNKLITSPTTDYIKCNTENCNRSATIMCSRCTVAKYCTRNCQQRDWYDNHVNDCQRLQHKRKTRP